MGTLARKPYKKPGHVQLQTPRTRPLKPGLQTVAPCLSQNAQGKLYNGNLVSQKLSQAYANPYRFGY